MPRPGYHRAIQIRPEPITFGNYCDGVRLGASHVKPLAGSLRAAAPGDLSPTARAQLDTIDDIAVVIDDIRTARHGSAAVKPAFDLLGAAFGATHDTLLAKSRLPGPSDGIGARAAALDACLFPNGLGFIRWDAHAAWSEADRILRVIAQLGLEAELDAMIGPELRATAMTSCDALREALGIGSAPRETPRSKALQQAMHAFSREVSRYARMLAADVDTTDTTSVERFRDAVMIPFDTFRSRRGTRRKRTDVREQPAPGDPSTRPIDAR
ncbi:hypothetical protein [Sandaracinus amylolyticus]|uniref:hypothetical protein n=1 Tax=Sandaracinus amylolyticus TaxID=927083 RepID=UPI001F1EC831|nr:hypothetical protein [Sandaracinus amylolyticus]UJR79913.1 Hypothetical protein I5071_19530 [Sandaracinus amylolyticus]